jgi:hypothetical protein
MQGDIIMRKIVEFVSNAIESFKNSMDQYGEARIIVNSSLVNDNIIRITAKANKQVSHLHLVK